MIAGLRIEITIGEIQDDNSKIILQIWSESYLKRGGKGNGNDTREEVGDGRERSGAAPAASSSLTVFRDLFVDNARDSSLSSRIFLTTWRKLCRPFFLSNVIKGGGSQKVGVE